jgi:hypothetical protein
MDGAVGPLCGLLSMIGIGAAIFIAGFFVGACVERTPGDPNDLLDLAQARALAGKPADAVAAYERLLKDSPDTQRAADIRVKIAELQSNRL